MKCHWCNKEIVPTDNSLPYYLECPEVHVLFQLNKVNNSIINYTIYHDNEDKNIRDKVVGDLNSNSTTLYRRQGAKGYKKLISIKWLPITIKDDTVAALSIINKLKNLVIFT